ncbi:TERF1-interacting nuclear factor 2 [Clupea harengus]|uniref:TERF1-interacting nuclear factor 2 n=1 Tax=Clupea harengus TaxID=7950 RepID=A0A6P3VMY9_CLUHA|nr:TERF1-interacting nuclear factor 2 [Clupea harengus]
MMDLEGSVVPIHSLCLLAPPLRLMSAAMWKVMLQRDVTQYGRLEEFITSISESVPGLLDYRHYVKLALGLRSRLILELCRGPEAPDPTAILTHLDRIPALVQSSPNRPRKDLKVEMTVSNFQNLVQTILDDPEERDIFFQEDFPEQYGPQYDKALEKLMWEFLTRLDQLLPIPDLAQTVLWLGNAPAFLDECAKSSTPPQLLRKLLQHEICLGHLGSGVSIPPTTGDNILSSLSLPPSGRTHQPGSDQISAKTTASDMSPQKSNQRRLRRTRSPIDPVIGSISLKDTQLAVTGAQLQEKSCQPEVTSHCDAEPATSTQVFTKIRQKTCSKHAKATAEEEEGARRENEPIGVLDKEEARVSSKRGRPRAHKGDERDRDAKGGTGKMERQENVAKDGTFTGVKPRVREDWTSLVGSCLKRQPRVVVRHLDVSELLEWRGSGVTDISQKRNNSSSALSSCSKRQLRVTIQRLNLSCPAVQALLNRRPAAASEPRKSLSTETIAGGTVRKRKRSDCLPSPAKTWLSSENKENIEGPQIISQRTNSPGKPPAESGEEMVADSEDESPNHFKNFLKGYYRTKHNTFVPTLEEYLKPGVGRRDLLSPGTGQRQ